MFCRYCGTENKEGISFCRSCGKPIGPGKSDTPSIQKEKAPDLAGRSVQKAPVNAVPKDVKKPKKQKAPVSKETRERRVFALVTTLLYTLTALTILLLFVMKDTVAVKTLYDSEVTAHLTLKEFLTVLLSGNRLFHPTLASTAIGVAVYILLLSPPVFTLAAIVNSYFKKKSYAVHVISWVVSIAACMASAAVVPLSQWLIPEFKSAISATAGIVQGDVDRCSFVLLIVMAAIALAMVVASMFTVSALNKRRDS